ncbi:MAG TPA: HAMP domain-containing sensor histidine kinase [Ilumatobacteraceae bacterium]|nr:HAMP domain-containing sensor histidine kinase [Ilumatobacteraceae bacterium]
MRRRLVVSTIAIVLVVLTALAIPVGIVVYSSAESELRGRLEEQIVAISSALADDYAAGQPPDLERLGSLVSAGDGLRITSIEDGVIVDQVPRGIVDPISVVRSGPRNTQIEVIADSAPLDNRFREQTYILLALAAGAVLAAAGLAAVQARQLARPLERVAATAARFGDGDFSSSKLPATQIPEIDRITNALRISGARVDRMLSTERHFTADATHQLRSGLTGIAMRFEILARHSNPEVVDEALSGLSQTEQLNATIDELLAATRDSTTRERTTFDLVTVVDDHVAEWSPRFAEARRSIAVITMETSRVVGTKGLAGQVIDILIDNALRHGRGSVTLLVEDTSVTVIDQGPGLSDADVKSVFEGPNDPSAPHGRGLPLARRLAQVDGGSVDIAAARPLRVRYRLVRA